MNTFKMIPSLFAGGKKEYDTYIIHGSDPVIRTKYLTEEELKYGNGRAYLEYYLRPRYLFMKLQQLQNIHK